MFVSTCVHMRFGACVYVFACSWSGETGCVYYDRCVGVYLCVMVSFCCVLTNDTKLQVDRRYSIRVCFVV